MSCDKPVWSAGFHSCLGCRGRRKPADRVSASVKFGTSRRFRMGTFSIWHILILGAIALVLFGGRGKVSSLMGDFGKGISSFKKGLADNSEESQTVKAEIATNTAKDKVGA